MDVESFTVNLTCLFCDSTLTGEDDAKFESGDMIKCSACGESNEYDSVLDVAKEKAISEAKQKVIGSLEKEFTKLFK